MHSVSSINTGALVAGNYAAKSQREFTKSIARLSTGKRAMYGEDPAGQGIADSLNANAKLENGYRNADNAKQHNLLNLH